MKNIFLAACLLAFAFVNLSESTLGQITTHDGTQDRQTLPNLIRLSDGWDKTEIQGDSIAAIAGDFTYPDVSTFQHLGWQTPEPGKISFRVVETEFVTLKTDRLRLTRGRFFAPNRHPYEASKFRGLDTNLVLTIPKVENLPDSFLGHLRSGVPIFEYQPKKNFSGAMERGKNKLIANGFESIPPDIKKRLAKSKVQPKSDQKVQPITLLAPRMGDWKNTSPQPPASPDHVDCWKINRLAFPLFLTDIKVEESENRLMLTGTKHFLTSELIPTVNVTTAGESGRMFTRDGSTIYASDGQAAVISFHREFRTVSTELEPVEVKALTPSGEEIPIANLRAQLNNSSTGFLINQFQEVHSDFATLLRPEVPIFRMQREIVDRKMYFTREQFSVTEPDPKR